MNIIEYECADGIQASECAYYMGKLSSPDLIFFRKLDSNYNEIWSKYYEGIPTINGFALDSINQKMYFISQSSIDPLTVFQIRSSDGGYLNGFVHQTGGIKCDSSYCVLTLSNDNSTLYVSGIDTALFGHVCKYPVSFSSVTCYRMSNYFYIYSMLYIQNDELFISGNRVDSNNNVQVGRISLLSTGSLVWANFAACSTGCSSNDIQSVMNNDKSTIQYIFSNRL